MSNKKPTKNCSVCGEKAFGFNFGATSCESCKAFFRRNASKLNQYICSFEDRCKIDQDTRKLCRKCRLRKCFAVGMKQEWILNDREREERRIKIEKNRKVRENINKIMAKCESGSQTESICSDSNQLQNLQINDMSDEYIPTVMQIENFVSNDDNNETNYLDLILENKQIDEICDSTYENAVQLELADLPIQRPVNDFLGLTEVEGNRLIELLNATSPFKTCYPSNTFETSTSFEDLIRFFFFKFEFFTQKYIQVVKCLNSFTNICENDQITLVKYSSIEVLLMRTALYYNCGKEQWIFNIDSNNSIIFKLDVLRNSKRNAYTIFKSYLNQIINEWENDTFVLDLLMTILLFNPDRPNIIHKEPIKFQQHLYMYLLQRYLQMKYKSECESKVKFLRILNVLQDLQKLHEIHRCNYQEMDPKYFGPLLKEILDLNLENRSTVL